MQKLIDDIFAISNDAQFNEVALKVFQYQYAKVPVYREYCNFLKRNNPSHYNEIPFLPLEFFKTKEVIDPGMSISTIFKSSGTGGNRSTHYVHSTKIYEQSFLATYKKQIGNPTNQIIAALLPNYLEQGESSLVYMVNTLIKETNDNLSSFILNNPSDVQQIFSETKKLGKQFVLFGVSYALLDLLPLNINLEGAIIIETGGMKGRRKELTKSELHQELIEGLSCKDIRSEYGMTELLSQAYCHNDLKFSCPPWMKVLTRDVNDPLSLRTDHKTGGINIIDLANIYSCSFIATQDLGKVSENTFEILGRFDHSDIRGCNLLVQ